MARLKVTGVLECASAADWERWLGANHDRATEAWLRLAKKGASRVTVTRADALEIALCYGWIDGLARSEGEEFWLQRFTPRTRRSKWSRINREAAERLIETGKMRPAGLAAIEAARADGRWAAAYAPQSEMPVPEDLLQRLKERPAAARLFDTLNARNRFAILYRIQDAKKPETRARRIEKFVVMLERGEKIY